MRIEPALFVLEDGTVHEGTAYGARGSRLGEAVFSTGMTGYQETLTDPSYARQIIVQTAPHIGNTGVNDEDPESRKIWVAGYVVRDAARRPSNWRSVRSLEGSSPPRRWWGSRTWTPELSPVTCATTARCAPASSPGRLPRVRSPSWSKRCAASLR